MTVKVGNVSTGEQFIAATTCDAINEAVGVAAAGAPFVAINGAASKVWIQGDPDDNTWADMSAGIWSVMITYIDNTAAADNSD